jgi:hypothetical protein
VFAIVPERPSAGQAGQPVNGPFGGNMFVAMEEAPNYAVAFGFTSPE